MSSNVLKYHCAYVKEEEKRVIDSNEFVARKLGKLLVTKADAGTDGEFMCGLDAQRLEGVFPTEAGEEGAEGISHIIKAQSDETARREEEAQQLLQEARDEAERIRHQQQIDKLEPEFIDTLTGNYEHIFPVDLQNYRERLVFLIGSALRKAEGGRDFIVHVSSEDYPYVSMQKKQLMAGVGAPGAVVEIIEDAAVGRNECLIETNNGIFDCGLETELQELAKKLKLLSYERPAEN